MKKEKSYLNISMIEDELGRVTVSFSGAGYGENLGNLAEAMIGQLLMAERFSNGKLIVQIPVHSEHIQ